MGTEAAGVFCVVMRTVSPGIVTSPLPAVAKDDAADRRKVHAFIDLARAVESARERRFEKMQRVELADFTAAVVGHGALRPVRPVQST